MLITAMSSAVKQRAGAVIPQRKNVLGARLEGDFADPAEVLWATDHDGRLGVADEILHLGALVGRVKRQKHVTSAQRSQVQHHGFDGFFNLHRHPRALGQAQRLQQISHHGGGAINVAPAVVQAGGVIASGDGFNRHGV